VIFNQVHLFFFFSLFFPFSLFFSLFISTLFFGGLDVGEKWLVELMRSSHHEMHIDNGLLELVRFFINFST